MKPLSLEQFIEYALAIEEYFGESLASRVEWDEELVDDFKIWFEITYEYSIDHLDDDEQVINLFTSDSNVMNHSYYSDDVDFSECNGAVVYAFLKFVYEMDTPLCNELYEAIVNFNFDED